MTSLIFGYGMTGQSFDRYLTKNGVKFDIYDVKHVDHPNAFSKLPSKEKLQSYEMVYISPGINILELYPNNEFEKVNFKTDLDIFFEEPTDVPPNFKTCITFYFSGASLRSSTIFIR